MHEDLADLHKRVADLARIVEDIDRRVAALEERADSYERRVPFGERHVERAQGNETVAPPAEATPVLSLVGRTCLVLGGAYLLRWLTDAGTLPRSTGVFLGLAYGVVWLLAMWRDAGGGRRRSAGLHSIASVLIVFPLLWESTFRFQMLTQVSAAALMAAFTCLGLAIAWGRRLQPAAWVVTTGGLLAAIAFMAGADGRLAPMALYLAVVGVLTLWLGYVLDWIWLRWPVALAGDLTIVAMVAGATDVWHRDRANVVMLVQLVFFAGYLASFAARTLYRSREVVPFEVMQTLALLVVSFGGAVYLMIVTASSAVSLGIASLVFGACCYGVAFVFSGWRGGHWKNFVFYASLGAVFTLAGTAITVAPAAQAIAWSALAVVSAWAGRRYSTVTVSSHAAIYTIAAAIVSGLLLHATDALHASASVAWSPLLVPALLVLAAAAISCATPLSSVNESWGVCSRIPKIALAAVLLVGLGGVVCGAAVPLLAGVPGTPAADAAATASIRTVVLGISVVFLGWAAGRTIFAEGRWLMYVVLVVGGVKLLIEDLPLGRPSTLFLTFAVYGTALILGPRFARPSSPAAPPQSIGT